MPSDPPRHPAPPLGVPACDPFGEIEERLGKHDIVLADIVGKSGDNGKVGELRRRLDKLEARRWFVITTAVGLLVTVLSAAIVFGRWMGSIETDVASLKQHADRHHRYAPDAPAKD